VLGQLQEGLRVRFARNFLGPKDAAFLDHPAADRSRKFEIGVVACDGVVDLGDSPLGEKLLIGASDVGTDGEDEHPGSQSIESVRGTELGQIEPPAQQDQRRAGDIGPARHRREEMWLVDHQYVLVVVHYFYRKRHHRLDGRIAVEIDVAARHQR
jgi:hypothetical protein